MTDRLERFPFVWCDTCEKIQPMTFDVLGADNKNDHRAADIVRNECKSIIEAQAGIFRTASHMLGEYLLPSSSPCHLVVSVDDD